MNGRAHLYRVVHNLKHYLRWQHASGAPGSRPAPADKRRAFEAKQHAREQAKIDRVKRQLNDAPSPAKARSRHTKPAAAPNQNDASGASAGSPTSPAEPTQRSTSDEPTANKPTADKPTADNPTADAAAGSSPWKTLGSRPQKRFNQPTDTGDAVADQDSSDSTPDGSPEPAQPAASTDESRAGESRAGESRAGESKAGETLDGSAADMAPPADYHPGKLRAQKPSPTSDGAASAPEMSNRDKLDYLRDYMGDCRRCGLCEHRTNIAFGTGDAQARLVFVGEAPGYNEDKQGEPFVGKAGGLLDKMIAAMGLERDDVYICNVIKCRPPKNRDPHADEIAECSPFLRKQIEAVDPDVIVTLGKFAGQFMTDQNAAMGAMRGQWHDWKGVAVMPTYHPAYLLRSPDQKSKTWSDLQMVMKRLNTDPKG